MWNLSVLFGRSPFESLVGHARKVHECVALVRPVAEAILASDEQRLADLQHEMSKTEYEADQLKDQTVVIDKAYVDGHLGDIVKDPDLSRYIL